MLRTPLRVLTPLLLLATAAQADDAGKLLIIGGGMTREMAPVIYGRLADELPPGAAIGVLPTAGDDAPASQPTTRVGDPQPADRFAANVKGHPVRTIPLTRHDAVKADDAQLAAQISACGGLFFGGGAQSRVIAVFHPDGRETAISRAVEGVLARGGIVAGTSAGAEIMSDPMILMGDSDDALAGKPVPIGRGMGYFKSGLVDQHFLQRGRFGRLVVALEQTQQRFGFGISEARALLVDRASGRIETIGPDACVFIDRRSANGRANIRVSLLGSGDVIDGRSGAVTVAPARSLVTGKARRGALPGVRDPWARLAVGKLIHELVTSDCASGALLDRNATLTLSVDDQTQIFGSAEKPDEVSVLNLRLDIARATATQPTAK